MNVDIQKQAITHVETDIAQSVEVQQEKYADNNGTTLQNMNITTLEALIQSKIDASKETIKAETKLELINAGALNPTGTIISFLGNSGTNNESVLAS